MATEYKLQLGVQLEVQGLDKQIKSLEKNYVFKLKVTPDLEGFDEQLQKLKSDLGKLQHQLHTMGNKQKPIALFDEAKNNQILNNLQAKMNAIKASATKVIKESMTTVDTGKGSTLTTSSIQYTDSVGKIRTATLEWQKNQQGVVEAVKLTNNYLDKSATVYDKMNSLADKFLDKSKRLGSSKEVTEGINLSNRIKELTNLGAQGGLTPDQTKELDNAYKKLQVLDSTVKASGKNLQNWSTEIGVAIKRTIEWAASVGLVYGALNQLKQGIQYVSDLNKELVDIQIVTGMNGDEVSKLASDYNSLAKELGLTTEAVTAASTEWFRQGKTVEETEQLVRTAAMMSKLGNIEAADATRYLTSIVNGFKLSAEDTVGVLDKLTVVDNSTATSISELAEAMSRTSNLAQQEQVSMEQLVSWIATVSSVTRRSAESVGTAFQSMLSRIQNIKLGNLDDESKSINDVEKALARVGIRLREASGDFRGTGDVINDVAKSWQNYSSIEKQSIAQAIAG